MTDTVRVHPPGPAEIAAQLMELASALDMAATDVARLDEEATQARHTHKIGFARAFLGASGAMDCRKQQAILETEHQELIADIAEQKLRSAREAVKVLYGRIEVARSLNAALRAEASTANSGATP